MNSRCTTRVFYCAISRHYRHIQIISRKVIEKNQSVAMPIKKQKNLLLRQGKAI
ncbi:MAG: hypothetical protein E6Q59_10890 [Nitrosomonas sp.]|nr:MAG: hypothetical protein E6Q59_10890 [Nitrosomonas sp.]